MFLWVIVMMVVICGVYAGIRIAKSASNADKTDAKLILNQSIQDGMIKLPDCERAYECYLSELRAYGKFPDCEKCRYRNVTKAE